MTRTELTSADEVTTASRWGPAAGIGFAVLLLYALLGPPWPPAGDAPDAAWEAHLASAGNRIELLAAEARRTGVIPRWLATAGLVTGIAQLGG